MKQYESPTLTRVGRLNYLGTDPKSALSLEIARLQNIEAYYRKHPEAKAQDAERLRKQREWAEWFFNSMPPATKSLVMAGKPLRYPVKEVRIMGTNCIDRYYINDGGYMVPLAPGEEPPRCGPIFEPDSPERQEQRRSLESILYDKVRRKQ